MARVLALGGSGFIGSYVVRKLLSEGHEVTSVDNFSKYGYVNHDFYGNENFKLVTKDVRNMYPKEFRDYDHVICFAALIGGIGYFHKIPYQIARDNTEILNHAIDCTMSSSPNATFHYLSSSMVYERVQRPVTEEDALNQPIPITNYGMQKLFGEFLMRGAHEEYGLNYMIIRPFNAVGSGELPKVNSKGELDFGMSHVIPDFVYKAMVKQSPFEILGDGEQVRTFTHALDIADAISLMINKNVKNDDFNLCGTESNTVSMKDLAMKVWDIVNNGEKFPEIKHIPAPKDDVRYRVGKAEKAKRVLGWEPKYDLDYILNDVSGFIRENLKIKTGST
jgi:nucleoside-diphosphate-sugar epimerase